MSRELEGRGIKRRGFLRAGVGLGAGLGLGLGSALLPDLAGASFGSAPRRLIIFATQQGCWQPSWTFNPAGLPESGSWEFELAGTQQKEFSRGLRPLHPWRDRLTIVDGLSLASGDADPASALRHEIGEVHMLTGSPVEIVAGIPQSSVPSIDQIIADHIARPDRLRSVEIGIGQPPFTINYRDRLQMLPAETRPEIVWERLFGLADASESASSRAEQALIMERVEAQYGALAARSGPEGRAKLELHRDLIRDLDRKIEGLLAASCEVPPQPQMQMQLGLDYGESFTTNVEMLRAAMACDLVRVATLHMGNIPGETLGYPGLDLHNDVAHDVYFDEQAREIMTQWTAYHAAQFGELLAALDAVPEGEGSMLDHTLVVWIGELGDGAHGFDKWPCVLAGGQAWRNGRILHHPRDIPFRAWSWDGNDLPTSGRAHQELLNALAQAFEVPALTGEQGYWRAPLRELVDRNGLRMDSSKVIPGLFG